ncbi:MAG: hypothetical protein GEV11_21405 [Streptosporangiales bacterium]|nr:hypothetical protein [Streptosporangiales bacterium]
MHRTGEGLRTKEQVAEFFAGYELVDPGLVPVTQWRPDADETGAEEVWLLGGLGRKR